MTRRRRRPPGWVPQQHGAWAMLVVPAVTGTVLLVRDHGWRWSALPVLAVTVVGYFLLNAVTLWLKSGRRARYLPPVRTYAVATAVVGLGVLAAGPGLVGWLLLAAPLLAVALVLASHRRDRALGSGLVTVAAACLVTPVLWSAGLTPHLPLGALGAMVDEARRGSTRASLVGAVTLVELLYFAGTVVYVKTMIRERGDRGWLRGSIAYHAAAAALVTAAAAAGIPSGSWGPAGWWLAVVMGLVTVRAWLLPRLGPLRGRSISPMQVGLVEIGFSLAVLAGALAL